MSSSFYKAEISNIMAEMIRIIDRLNEIADNKDMTIDWPAYCETMRKSDSGSDPV